MIVAQDHKQPQSILKDIPAEGQETAQWLIDQWHAVNAENQQLRARCAELEEHAEALQRRLDEQYTRYSGLLDWMRKLFSNRTIPTAVKLVLWYYHLCFALMRPQSFEEEMRIGMAETAAALGCDVGTVRRATDKAEAWNLLQRRYETVQQADGDTKKFVHITLANALAEPTSIHMEKAHGGARERKCPHCGSTDVDRYTVQHCRRCHTNAWYGQPGLRSDANVLDAQKAQQHMTHAAIAPEQETDRKQDAFTATASFTPNEPDPLAVSNRLEEMIDCVEQERINSQTPCSEDDQPEQCDCGGEIYRYSDQGIAYCLACWHAHSPAEGAAPLPNTEQEIFILDDQETEAPITAGDDTSAQLAAEHYPPHNHGKLPEMELHQPVCRLCGPIAQWIWSPVDRARICPKCLTPQR